MADTKKPAPAVVAIRRWTGDVKETAQRMRADAAHLKDLGAQASAGARKAGSAIESAVGQLFEGAAKQFSAKLDEIEAAFTGRGKRK